MQRIGQIFCNCTHGNATLTCSDESIDLEKPSKYTVFLGTWNPIQSQHFYLTHYLDISHNNPSFEADREGGKLFSQQLGGCSLYEILCFKLLNINNYSFMNPKNDLILFFVCFVVC